ncbi:diguanylate cyclase [Actinoplanes sp. NEAU-A12]|uniref:Diguanylate cyclase n=1 Tax=Actinoplanes sandaracinus TaxID=3045177 RepID=A0ABT6WWW8_9ACTN|nr:GGDEF domain-containing protein [Actinoplanes sandaracinus]MDI6104247.1 diguanylate cyclase [Actinoplanes sandaracinus]
MVAWAGLGRAEAVDGETAEEQRVEAEIAAIEEQPRLDHDPAGMIVRARRLADRAERIDRPDLRHRTRMIEADMLSRQGDLPAAGRILHDVHAWAVAHRHPHLLTLSHWHLSGLFAQLGDATTAVEHAVRAMEILPTMTPAASTRLRMRCTLALADTYGDTGDYAAARERYAEAERMAVATAEINVRFLILNNLAYTEFQAGENAAASEAADRLLALVGRHDLVLDDSTRDTVGKIWLSAGRHAEAIALLQPSEKEYSNQYEEANSVASCLVTLAEAYRMAGELDQAETALRRCRRLCAERGLAAVEVEAQRVGAELLAAAGRFGEAFTAHKAFHAAAMRLHSAQRDARTRVLQVMYETEEALRAGERARQLAMRDPLTGLYNRRFVDAELPLLLHRAAETGTALSVAVLDLDYFKRINDTCSHEAGDRVLRQIADLLTARAQTLSGSFGARLGGEEFLFVMPGVDGPGAVAEMSGLCQTIRRHDWRPVTGHLPVTTSIGVSSSADGHGSAADLLREADMLLYRSKADGRDRITSADDRATASGPQAIR